MGLPANFSTFLDESLTTLSYSRVCWYSFQFPLKIVIQWAVLKARGEILSTPATALAELDCPPCESIPLLRDRYAKLITYQSAIALRLGHEWQVPVTTLAKAITSYIRLAGVAVDDAQSPPSPPSLTSSVSILLWLSALDVSVQAEGYLRFRCSAKALSLWLQSILDSPFLDGSCLFPQPLLWKGVLLESVPFEVLHSHARCCSLLRLAHRLGQILLHPMDVSPALAQALAPPWSMLTPATIDWEQILPSDAQNQDIVSSALSSQLPRSVAYPCILEILHTLDYYAQIQARVHVAKNKATDSLSEARTGPNDMDTILAILCSLSQVVQRFDRQFTLVPHSIDSRSIDSHATEDIATGRRPRKRRSRSPHVPQAGSSIDAVDSVYHAQLGLVCIMQKLLAALLTDALARDNNGKTIASIPYEL